MKQRIIKVRKYILIIIFGFTAIHFLKDITQDILNISTPLDALGDVKEDLSMFPGYLQGLFQFLGYASFIAEAFLLLSIPKIFYRKTVTQLEKAVYIVVAILLLYFLTAILLDPRFIIR